MDTIDIQKMFRGGSHLTGAGHLSGVARNLYLNVYSNSRFSSKLDKVFANVLTRKQTFTRVRC